MAQALTQRRARLGVADIELDGVEPCGDRRTLGQGCRELVGEEAGTCRCHRPVDRREKAPLALAGEGRHQLEVAPCRRVDLHDRARHDAPWRVEMCRSSLLGQADIVDQRAAGGDLRAAEIAEPVECLDPVELLQPTPSRVALETRVG